MAAEDGNWNSVYLLRIAQKQKKSVRIIINRSEMAGNIIKTSENHC
jgi:hypothetical protein